MEFSLDDRTLELREELVDFMDEFVYPNEKLFDVAAEDIEGFIGILGGLQQEARKRGLWNFFIPDPRWGPGLTNLQYAPLAEVTGRSPLAPYVFNCSAPDTGNMEILAEFGTPEQQKRYLEPLLSCEVRSAFCMTEPGVASSDPTNIQLSIRRDGDDYVLNGRKWWITGALDPRCEVLIVMGVTDPDGPSHQRHTMVLVPRDTPGVTIERDLTVLGHHSFGGHAEISFTDARVPTANVLGVEGGGFAIGQARLGPGRIHHCMRFVGMAERAFDLMCERALARSTFGKPLADQGVVQGWIADARIRIEQARLLTMKTAWLMDTVGKEGARVEISAIKVAVPEMAAWVVDKAIQVHGAAGLSQDFPLANFFAGARVVRLGDGPDEVHRMVLARRELRRYKS